MCIPYKKDIMQESHTYYLLSKYMDQTDLYGRVENTTAFG